MSHVFKWADKSNVATDNLFFINYAFATLLTFAQGYETVFTPKPFSFYILACITGAFFAFNFYLFFLSVQRIGISISNSITRLSISIPTLGSIVIFGEHLNLLSGIGLALTAVSLPLATPKKQKHASEKIAHSWWLAVSLFLVFGIADFNFKIFSETFKNHSPQSFLTIIFFTATLCSLGMALKNKNKITLKDLLFGLGLGLLNILASYFMLLALQIVPGHLAYPLHGMGCILVSTLSGIVIWKESLTKRQGLFLIIAVTACVLLNLEHL